MILGSFDIKQKSYSLRFDDGTSRPCICSPALGPSLA